MFLKPIVGALDSLILKRCNALARDGLNDTAQFADAFTQPGEVLGTDVIMLRVARLNIGILEQAEAPAIRFRFARPDMKKTPVELVREVAQMLEIMAVGRVEGAGQKNGMIKSLRCLMELEYRVLEKYSAASFR